MQLGLSSDTAPDADAVELVAACERRGLATLELRLGARDTRVAAAACAASPVRIAGLVTNAAVDAAADIRALVRLQQDVGAPLIVAGSPDPAARIAMANRITDAGGAALPLMSGPASGWVGLLQATDSRIAWQVDDTCADPAGDLDLCRDHHVTIEYVRFIGGGPETTMQEGRGVGTLMQRLTLSAYTGPLVLAPSSPAFRVAWSAWLGRRGGWGCGSRASAPLPLAQTAPGLTHHGDHA